MADATTTETDSTTIRAWARDNGYPVKETGRISGVIKEAYRTGTPASGQPAAA